MFNSDIRTSLFSGKTGIPAKTRTPSHNTRTLLKPVPYGRGYMDRALRKRQDTSVQEVGIQNHELQA